MTQSSQASLDKRLTKKKPHQSHSFDQLVGDATVARLRPYIQQQVNEACNQVVQGVYQAMIGERAMIQTRQLAFERLLTKNCSWFNEDVLAMAVADVEDESSGAVAVEDEAKAGDKVRVEFQAKSKDQGEWSPSNKLAIHSLLTKGPGGTVQTGSEDFEKGVETMKAGETREFLLPEPAEEGKEPENTRIRVTVKRVSRVLAKPEAAAAAEQGAANG